MSAALLSVEMINPADASSFLVGKESNRTVAVVVRDAFGLECMRCKTPRNCNHISAVVKFEAPNVPARLAGWCKCAGDQLAVGNAVYFSNERGHGWNCATCGLLLQEG